MPRSSELTKPQIDDMLNYQPFGGQSIAHWFRKYAEDDLNRIFSAVQRGTVEETLTVPAVMKSVFGKDGATQMSRNSARMLSRTLTIATANHANYQTLVNIMDQGDDVTAIEYSAAFDGKTCPACAYYDG
ncbi:MAG: phage head morphogenesis protein, partial [Planctomycetaceae bacterium]|nr:phage head morphogenesis protein [Planctomycetaceae bacterium]